MKSALETSPRKEKTPHEHFPREGALLTSHNHKSAASRLNHCAVCFQTGPVTMATLTSVITSEREHLLKEIYLATCHVNLHASYGFAQESRPECTGMRPASVNNPEGTATAPSGLFLDLTPPVLGGSRGRCHPEARAYRPCTQGRNTSQS